MNTLAVLALALAAPPDAGGWKFVDEARLGGRSILTFRTADLGPRPIRPLHPEDAPPPGSVFGAVPLGLRGAFRPGLVWHAATGTVWFDADGDGRYAASERHQLGPAPLAVQVNVPFADDRSEPRTLLIRRRGAGLAYAVRGYTTGRIVLGGKTVAAALTDGDADGCFDSAAADRVWLDLDGDGRFDPLTEQFPLGNAIAHGGTSYLLRPRPDGLGIQVRERPAEVGTLVTRVNRPAGSEVVELNAQYVSEFGELVVVAAADTPTPVPAGRYRVESVRLKLTAADGKVWHYTFSHDGRNGFDVTLEKGRQTVHEPVAGIKARISVNARKPAAPGKTVIVEPDVAAGPLTLTACEVGERDAEHGREVTADVTLAGAGGVADRAESGFA
jgi:hypothetical protein